MYTNNVVHLQRDLESEVHKQFSNIKRNINKITKNIKFITPKVKDHESKLLYEYLNHSMNVSDDREINNITLNYNNEYNSIKNQLDRHVYKYNLEELNESFKLRNELMEIINDDLYEGNVENGIIIKNSILKEIKDDMDLYRLKEESSYKSIPESFNELLPFN